MAQKTVDDVGRGMEELQKFIEEELQRREINASQLAAKADLAHSVISKMLKSGNRTEPELGTLSKLAGALNVKRWQLVRLLDGDATLSQEFRVRTLAELIATMPASTQDAITAFIETLVAQNTKKSD